MTFIRTRVIELTNVAYALVRNRVTTKSSRGGVYKVQVPRKLTAKLEALRGLSEDLSDVILRLSPAAELAIAPSLAVERWLAASRIVAGPVSRPVDRHAHVAPQRLSGEAVSLVVKERVAATDIDPTGFSGRSLRAGFATSAVQPGVSTFKIKQQTGHASDAMLSRYVRDGELFLGNAAGILL